MKMVRKKKKHKTDDGTLTKISDLLLTNNENTNNKGGNMKISDQQLMSVLDL